MREDEEEEEEEEGYSEWLQAATREGFFFKVLNTERDEGSPPHPPVRKRRIRSLKHRQLDEEPTRSLTRRQSLMDASAQTN